MFVEYVGEPFSYTVSGPTLIKVLRRWPSNSAANNDIYTITEERYGVK